MGAYSGMPRPVGDSAAVVTDGGTRALGRLSVPRRTEVPVRRGDSSASPSPSTPDPTEAVSHQVEAHPADGHADLPAHG